MITNRRRLFQGGLGLSAGLIGLSTFARAADSSSLAPLKAAGLDPLDTYIRMFASKTTGEEVAWWFMGAIPLVDEQIGEIPTYQEETVRIHRTDANNAFSWTEAGVFREIVTGEVPTTGFDPASGKTSEHGSVLAGKGMTATVTATKDGDGLKVVTNIPGQTFLSTTVDAKIEGDRVCLTHIEEKGRPNAQGQLNPNRVVFKIYASLADLKGKAPNVKASGYYGVRNVNTKKVGVNGLMHKAAMNEKVNPIAWDRIKKHHPTFITGDRFTPTWSK
jgi:hypothetical protein